MQMSRLEEYIAELCPDGVEFVALYDCVEKVNNIKWSDKKDIEYRYIDLTSVDRETHQITETQTIKSENAPSRAQQVVHTGDIIFGATRPMLQRYCMIKDEFDNQVCSTGFCVLRTNINVALQKWIYYQIASTEFFAHVEKYQKGASYPAISDADVKNYKIPLPPLPVQREIVRILDNFTELTTELTAELTARKKQYEYYRDELFGENYYKLLKLGREAEIKKVQLSDVGNFARGRRFVKTDMINEGKPCIHYGEMYTHYGVWAEQAKSFISPELATKLRVAHTGNVVIVAAGETVEDLGKGVAWLADTDVVVHDACYIYEHNLEPKYVSYFLRTPTFHSQIRRYISSGKISSISADGLGKAIIPVPPIEVQKKIVSILDKFDVLVNDISDGLPAEIETRRKQYEYYRDKLLTFKEKSV